MFDAQCDFAAVVYGVNDDPDRLLLYFASAGNLRATEHRGAHHEQTQQRRTHFHPNLVASFTRGRHYNGNPRAGASVIAPRVSRGSRRSLRPWER